MPDERTPRKIFSDNGTNFKATEKVGKEELKKVDFGKLVVKYDQTKWRFNPHMGGASECLIRSITPNSNYNDDLMSAEYITN